MTVAIWILLSSEVRPQAIRGLVQTPRNGLVLRSATPGAK